MSNRIAMVAVVICLSFTVASVALGQTAGPMSGEEESVATGQPGDAPSMAIGSSEAAGPEPPEMDMGKPPGGNFSSVVPLLVLVAVIFFIIWTSKRRPSSGIAGWLLLPAIGLALSPIIAVVVIIVDLRSLPRIRDIYVEAVRAGIFRNGVLGAFASYAAYCFFRKKENAPQIIIWLLFASVGLSVALMWQYGEIFAKSFIIAAIQAVIWIPYFLTSKRVKATFGEATADDEA